MITLSGSPRGGERLSSPQGCSTPRPVPPILWSAGAAIDVGDGGLNDKSIVFVGRRKPETFQVPRLCIDLREIATGRLPDMEKVTPRSHAGKAARDQGRVAKANAQAKPRDWDMARAGRCWLLRLSRRTD